MRVLRVLPGVFVVSMLTVCAMTFCRSRSVNPEVAALLKGPGAVSIWQGTKMAPAKGPATSKVSPLVAQARIYARLLNPPSSIESAAKDTPASPKQHSNQGIPKPQSSMQIKPPRVSPAFRVHATSVYAKYPEKSMALISQPGRESSWVRPGDMLDYLKVVEIRKDAVLYTYEGTTGEVAWESNTTPALQPPKQPCSTMALDLAGPSVDPVLPSPGSASPLPNRLAASSRQVHPSGPRPPRGGR